MSDAFDPAVQVLHESGQEALLELELATLDMNAHEKWTLEQLLLAYVADSVPVETWHARPGGRHSCRETRSGARPGTRVARAGLTHDVRASWTRSWPLFSMP